MTINKLVPGESTPSDVFDSVNGLVGNTEVQQVINKTGIIKNKTTDYHLSYVINPEISWYSAATRNFISQSNDIMSLLGCVNTVNIQNNVSMSGNTRNDLFYTEELGEIGGKYLMYNYLVHSSDGVNYGEHDYMFIKRDGVLQTVSSPKIEFIQITDNVRLYIVSRLMDDYVGQTISAMIGNSLGLVAADIAVGSFKASYSSTPFPSKIIASSSQVSINVANNLHGKKLVVIGDSMINDLSIGTENMWPNIVANKNGMDIVNYGVSGSRLAVDNATFGPSVLNRYSGMDNDAEYVGVFAGTNDASELIPLGNAYTDSFNAGQETFNGALNDLCNGLITKYPNSKIFFVTPYARNTNYKDYADAIKERCGYYNIPVFDNFKDGGVCWTNNTQVLALTKNDTYHLNSTGHIYVSSKYENFIRSL